MTQTLATPRPARAAHQLRLQADRIFNRPLLLHPTKAQVLLWALGDRIGIDSADFMPGPAANRFIGKPKGIQTEFGMIAFYNVQNGIGVIPVIGSLVNRGDWIGDNGSGLISYEAISFQLDQAMADAEVKAVVFDIESPGGEAAGMYNLAARIRAAREIKPIVAVVNDMAASAGYGLASAAEAIVISPTSLLGSIGVLMIHFDYSKAFAEVGIKPTLIFSGAHKVDGNPYEALPPDVAKDLKRECDLFYDRFIETVALGQPDLGAAKARATEARCYVGAEAVAEGLANDIGTIDEVITELSSRVH